MPNIAYPDELKKSHWDKKKGALEGATALEVALKELQKQHEAFDWGKVAAGWAKGMGDAAKLQALHEALDKLYRTKASPLKLLAGGVETAADKAAKAKDAAKPLKEACAAITKAALVYGKAIAKGLDELEAEMALALKAVKPKEDEGAEGDAEEDSALVDPKRLLKQLQQCKADPARVVNFAYLDDGKQDPVLVVSPRLSGRTMMVKLVKDIGIKTGSFGLLSLDETLLKLVVEKKYSGLVKRIRIPIRGCGFKLGKVLLVDEKGATLDEDHEDSDQASTPGTEKSGSGSTAGAPLADALQLWSEARAKAIASLKGVAKEIADLKDPDSAKAVVEISAVLKNLTAEPRTAQQVAELVRYIDQDDVVLDVSEFASDIRTPLLKALAQLQRTVSA
jgi:hypothetical protein